MTAISVSKLARFSRPLFGAGKRRKFLKLDIRVRLAAGVSLATKVANLMSRHFLKRYRVGEMLEYSWRFCTTVEDDPRQRRELIESSIRSLARSCAEGYDPSQTTMALYLLEEIGSQDGRNIEWAMKSAIEAYAVSVLFKLGLTRDGKSATPAFFSQLGRPAFECAAKIIDRASGMDGGELSRNSFSDIGIRLPVLVAPRATGAAPKVPKGVPEHEFEP